MKRSKNISRSTLNYYVDIISILPFLFLLITGVVMLKYHTGEPYLSEIFNMNGYSWLLIHIITSVITVSMIAIHLILHLNWLKKLFSGTLNNKFKTINITLLVLSLLTSITAVFSWLIVDNMEFAQGLRGMHNKFGILLILFFVFHIVIYFKWLLNMTERKIRET